MNGHIDTAVPCQDFLPADSIVILVFPVLLQKLSIATGKAPAFRYDLAVLLFGASYNRCDSRIRARCFLAREQLDDFDPRLANSSLLSFMRRPKRRASSMSFSEAVDIALVSSRPSGDEFHLLPYQHSSEK